MLLREGFVSFFHGQESLWNFTGFGLISLRSRGARCDIGVVPGANSQAVFVTH